MNSSRGSDGLAAEILGEWQRCQKYTWDGLPIAADEPHGAAVIVRRPAAAGAHEYLILHRAHYGRDYAGDWAVDAAVGLPAAGGVVLGSGRAAASSRERRAACPRRLLALAALDLGGPWVCFGLDVPIGAQVRR